MNILDSKRGVNSVYPCIEGLTFYPWLYLVPQFRPKDVLMLGYAGGTVASLIRLFYGAVPMTAVDIVDYGDYGNSNVDFIQADARDYLKVCRDFHCIVVDLFEDGDTEPCEFITSKEFVADLRKKGGYIIVHANENTDMSNYGTPIKILSLNDSRFYYYTVYEITTLPISCVIE